MYRIPRIHLVVAIVALSGCQNSQGYFSTGDSGTDTEGDITTDTAIDSSTDVPIDGDHCGDGVLEEWRGEQCDDGEDNSDTEPDACRTDCTLPRCGDSVTDDDEECDDGNTVDNDACSNGCVEVLGDLCTSCDDDDECGRDIDLCIGLTDGDYCGVDCTGEIECPDGFTCVVHQCQPVSGVCAPCFDPDEDGYGIGPDCLGTDCDETDTSIHTGADELCDGLDNNCNGIPDEGDPEGGATCATGLLGVCAEGTIHCREAVLTCIPDTTAAAEACNDLDDNCDGAVDEDNPGGGTPCDTGLSGVCAAGEQECIDGSHECQQVHFSSPETCNGLDDNCNGPVDEGDPGGGAVCDTGDLGICAVGVEHCIGGFVVCNALYTPVSEDCSDSLDNNCDGTVNEGCCAHDLCTTGEPLPESCDPCVASICAGDDYCCTGWWDNVCIDAVFGICGLTTCSSAGCTAPTNPAPDCGADHHCVPSPSGVGGCTSPTGPNGQWMHCTDDGDCLPEFRCHDLGLDSSICLEYCNMGIMAACMTVPGTDCEAISPPAFAGGSQFGVCNVASGSAPPEWNCEDGFYAAGDGCDCGCGIFDPDCPSTLVSECEFCALMGSCSTTSTGCPGSIHPTENWRCS